MKILLEGAFGEANFGDDLLLLASLRALRDVVPNAELQVLARDSSFSGDYLDRFPGVDRVVRGWELATCGYELKLYAGGTQFYSYPKTNVASRDPQSSLSSRIGKKLLRILHSSKKNAFLGIGIGPFYDGNEEACERLLRTGDFLAVRDEKSQEYLSSWDIPSQALGADICFEKSWWLPSTHVKSAPTSTSLIGVVVRDFEYDLPGKSYFPPLFDFMKRMRQMGHDIRCFAFSELKDSTSITKLRLEGFEVNVWKGEITALQSYLKALSECSILISARYHGVVIGSVLGVPSIGIEVDPKVKLACDELGQGSAVWNTPFAPDDLFEKFEKICLDPAGVQAALQENTTRLSRRTLGMFNAFSNFVARGI